MIQGTTPTHRFNIPLDASIVQRIQVTYAQSGKVLLTKTDSDCRIDGNVRIS